MSYGYPFYPPKAQFFDDDGNPLSNGSVEFYDAGTSTLSEIWSDNPRVTPQANPVTLNSRGEPANPIFLAYGKLYDVVVKDELGATVYTVDNYYQASDTGLLLYGSGTPEGAVTAGIGTLYLRTNGGASTTLYVKESGTGNTGWVAK